MQTTTADKECQTDFQAHDHKFWSKDKERTYLQEKIKSKEELAKNLDTIKSLKDKISDLHSQMNEQRETLFTQIRELQMANLNLKGQIAHYQKVNSELKLTV